MEVNLKAFSDTLGPSKVLFIREPHIGLEAIIIVDNTAAGPSIGGVRMSPNVSPEEVFRLARAMTLKNAAAGLPHGGGKSGIKADPFMGYEEKEKLMRSFARLIADFEDYIPGPDMGTNEQCMAWVKDEMGRAVGLPEVLGGIPLDEIGATAFGLSIAAEVAAPAVGLRLEGSNLAVQGFGAVGKHTAKFGALTNAFAWITRTALEHSRLQTLRSATEAGHDSVVELAGVLGREINRRGAYTAISVSYCFTDSDLSLAKDVAAARVSGDSSSEQ